MYQYYITEVRKTSTGEFEHDNYWVYDENEQTARLKGESNEAGQRILANEIEQYVAPSARPAYIVQNPNCCASQTFGCGCGAVA